MATKLKTKKLSVDQKLDKLLAIMATKSDLKLMTTKVDLQLLATKNDLKSMATKNDLELMATKDDLKLTATKDDLRFVATKDDLELMATKDDLISEIRPLKTQVMRIEEKIDALSPRTNEDTVAAFKDIEKLKNRFRLKNRLKV